MPHNIEEVIGDIETVKVSLEEQVRSQIRPVMSKILGTAITQVENDADWKGNLTSSLKSHGVENDDVWPKIRYTVGTDKQVAPYAPFVEFGTGERSGKRGPGAIKPQRPDEYPAGYPYSSPDVNPAQLVGEIYEWVESKPIEPEKGSAWATAAAIAETIVEVGTYAHPFLRPAWFKHKLELRKAARKAVKNAFS